MKKDEALSHWKALPDGLPILPHFHPIPYKAEGSKYGACGIRIDGNPAFVDAVLSRLKDLLDGENQVTRLGLARNPVAAPTVNGKTKAFHNAESSAECCYIRLHMRGREGGMAMAIMRQGEAETARYAAAIDA